MNERDPALLDPGFRAVVDDVRAACAKRGVVMRPFFCLRHPATQAKLWRQSRSREEIENGGTRSTRYGLKHLRAAKCDYLVEIIEGVGPQSGPWATNAFPGNSWHQWGFAEDDFWLVEGSAVWSTRKLINGVNGYKVWAEEATRLGLRSLGSIGDWPHIQHPRESSPMKRYALLAINDAMRGRFASEDSP